MSPQFCENPDVSGPYAQTPSISEKELVLCAAKAVIGLIQNGVQTEGAETGWGIFDERVHVLNCMLETCMPVEGECLIAWTQIHSERGTS